MRRRRPPGRPAPLALLVLLAVSACGGGPGELPRSTVPPAEPWFDDVTRGAGIDFVQQRDTEVRYWFPEIMSGGGGWLDYDGDGDLDLYLVQGGELDAGRPRAEGNRLYRNDGEAGFVDVTARAGVGDASYGMGCSTGDYDGDGDLDLYVANYGPNVLYRNNGDGSFSDVSRSAGVDHPGWASSTAFVDYDGDGRLDLFVVNYVNWTAANEIECFGGGNERNYCHPLQYNAPAADVLYQNEGDGTFRDVSRAAGLLEAFGNGLGVAPGDFDLDGRVDLYVANDGMPNQLWMNQGDGTFVDRALMSGSAVSGAGLSQAGMGVAAVDVDQDGDLDLFMTHLRDETNTLYLNDGGMFEDATAAGGLAAPSVSYTGFGTGFADFDNDGSLDLYVVNGRVGGAQAVLAPGDPYAEPNQLFRGLGDGRFALADPPDGTAEGVLDNSRAAAFGDIDNDGDTDLVVVNNGGPARLLRNRRGAAHGWLQLEVDDGRGGDALGARLHLLDDGGAGQWRQLVTAYSYCAANDPAVSFGLGERSPARLEVTWPDGARATFHALRRDHRYELYRPASARGQHPGFKDRTRADP